jgi:hypothetical protein
VTTIDGDDAAEMVTDLLTECKSEVEGAWDWTALEGTVLLDTVANTYRYKLQGVYQGSKLKNVYDQTNDRYLEYNPKKVDEGLKYANPETGAPLYYDFVGWNNGEMLIDIFPVPDVDDTRLYVNGKYVQGDISYTDPSTTYIATPMLPLVLGTYALAISERGEDDGEQFNKADAKYHRALSLAIQLEDAAQGEEHSQWEVE